VVVVWVWWWGDLWIDSPPLALARASKLSTALSVPQSFQLRQLFQRQLKTPYRINVLRVPVQNIFCKLVSAFNDCSVSNVYIKSKSGILLLCLNLKWQVQVQIRVICFCFNLPSMYVSFTFFHLPIRFASVFTGNWNGNINRTFHFGLLLISFKKIYLTNEFGLVPK
jgi:hypothetical protein